MNRFNLKQTNLNPNFIGAWNLKSNELCDELVAYFELNHVKHKRGRTEGGTNINVKKSTDMSISPNEINLPQNQLFKKYFESLFLCYKDYLVQWPFLESFAKKLVIGSFNIQRYNYGEHFQQIHTERSGLTSLHRILAWMTYLNDVEQGGSTYFSHYDLDIQPSKGLTLIWPAEWTHAHKGNLINTGSKYIITGWLDLSE
jgi:hypothetical protein